MEDTEELKRIVSSAKNEYKAIYDIVEFAGKTVRANVVLVRHTGLIVSQSLKSSINILNIGVRGIMGKPCKYVGSDIMNIINNFEESRYNVTFDRLPVKTASKSETEQYSGAFLPVAATGEYMGMLIAYREKRAFSCSEAKCLEMVALCISLLCKAIKNADSSSEERMKCALASAVGSLSFSERKGVAAVFEDFSGDEGIIVLSKAAANTGVTRPVIMNGLRKLESAGIIQTHSLGAKGTFIKIENKYFLSDISKC